MKRIVLDFLRRGFAACGLGPIVLAVLYMILQRQAAAGISVIGSEGEFPRTVTVCKRIDERPKS